MLSALLVVRLPVLLDEDDASRPPIFEVDEVRLLVPVQLDIGDSDGC